MKKLFYILVSAIVALGAVACNNVFDDNIESNTTREGVSFTVALDEEASRIVIGDRVDGKHPITFNEGDVLYAENSELGIYEFVALDEKTFVCEKPSTKGKLPVELQDKSLNFYNSKLPYSTKGAEGIVLKANKVVFTEEEILASNKEVILSLGSPVLWFNATEDVVLQVNNKLFVQDNHELVTEMAFTTGEYYVAIQPTFEEVNFAYFVASDLNNAVRTFTKKLENKIYRLGALSSAVAIVGGKNYIEIGEAMKAAKEGDGLVTLANDLALTEPLVIPADCNFTFDLNGKTISKEDTEAGAQMIEVEKGAKLVLTSNVEGGKVSYNYTGTPDSSYGKGNYAIWTDGTLVIEENVTVENVSAKMSHAGYALNVNNGVVTINGGNIVHTNGIAIRQASFNNANNTININGGYIEGTRALQMQLPGSASATHAPELVLNIAGGELKSNEATYNMAIYVFSNGQSAENVDINITGGTFNGNIMLNAAATDTMKEGALFINGGNFNGEYLVYSYSDDQEKADEVISIIGGLWLNYGPNYVDYEYKAALKEGETNIYEIVNKVPVATILGREELIFETVAEAFEAVQSGETVNVIAGNYSVFPAEKLKEGVTVVCAEGTVFTGTSSLNVKGATIQGAKFANAGGTVALHSTVDGNFVDCEFEGNIALRYAYAPAEGKTTTFTNCSFVGTSTYGVHFDSGKGKVVFDGCTFSGFNAFGAELELLTIKNSRFVSNGTNNYNGVNLWGNTVLENVEFETGKVTFEWCDPCGTDKTYVLNNVTANGEPLTIKQFANGEAINFVALIDGVKYTYVSTADALKAAIKNNEGEDIVLGDATFEGLFFVDDKDLNIWAFNSRKAVINGKLAIAYSDVNVKGVHFKNTYAGSVTTGNQYADKSGAYTVGLYTGSVNIDDCEFTLTKDGAINFYSMIAGDYCTVTNSKFNCNGWRPIRSKVNITVDGCEFDDQNKYALQIWGNTNNGTEKVVFTNNTITNPGKTSGNAQKPYQLAGVQVSQSYPISNVSFEVKGNTMPQGVYYTYDENDIVKVETFASAADAIEWIPEGGAAAKIGNIFYSTVQKAVNVAEAGATVTLLNGTHILSDLSINKDLTFKGESKENTIVMVKKSMYLQGRSLKFENLTYDVPAGLTYTESAYAFIHHAENFDFENCIINRLRVNVKNANIANSTFEVKTNSGFDGYGLYYYGNNGSKVVIDNSVFKTAGKAICVYNEAASNLNLEVNDTQFYAGSNYYGSSDKAAISIHTELGIYGTLVVNNSTAEGFAYGLYREFKNGSNQETNNFVKTIDGRTRIADGIWTVGDTYELETVEALYWFANEVNANGNSFAGKTVKLVQNMDLAGSEWAPVGQKDATLFAGTFDGNGKTISNLSITEQNSTVNYATGFFGWIGNPAVIKNVTIEGATIKGLHFVGTLVGHLSGGADIDNCKVNNATIVADPTKLDSAGEFNGDKVGGIAGMIYDGSVVSNCQVTNTTIEGYRHMGGIVGYSYGEVKSCKVSNVTITVNNINNYKEYEKVSEYGVAGIVGVNNGKVSGNNGVATVNIPGAVYLKPNSNWQIDGARFALYNWDGNGHDRWFNLEKVANNLYAVILPNDTDVWKNVIFCRMNGSTTENNWNNKWNQTADLVLPTNGNDTFNKANGMWDGATNTWEKVQF